METELQGFLERSVVGVTRRTAVLLAILTTSLLGLGVGSAIAEPAPPTSLSATTTSTVATPTTLSTTLPGAVTAADTATTAATATTPTTPSTAAPGALLCSGYAACSTDGFTTNDYQAYEKSSWWRMYPGDNCTNYVAYVESQIFGVTEPTYLLGDAYEWAANAKANGVPVDDTPTVGAVAFWGPGTLGMERYGHVAVVEDVGPDNSYIDVSQSGMGKSDDGYDWERIYADSTSWEPWPDSFIHFTGTNIPQAQATAAQAPVSWPQVMLSQLTWGSATLSVSGAPLQLATLG